MPENNHTGIKSYLVGLQTELYSQNSHSMLILAVHSHGVFRTVTDGQMDRCTNTSLQSSSVYHTNGQGLTGLTLSTPNYQDQNWWPF